jgi:protoheme IX farnesyltransferase
MLITHSTYFDKTSEARVRDYISLLKPRVMSLVVFTGMAGMFLAPGHIHPLIAIIAILCINMWYDRDIDIIMERTKTRPIPKGIIKPEDALEFGVALAGFSVLVMAFAVNYLSAFILLFAILFYVFIYTIWLKRRTAQNIVIGGAAGAFPPMIGWASVTGSITIEPLLCFLIIFLWTPPHFWALALYKSDDYKLAKIPMLPVVSGKKETKKQIILYSIIMFIASLTPCSIGMAGLLYFVTASLLGALFIHFSIKIYFDENHKLAPAMFGYSILYLFLIFTLLMIDKIFYYPL